MKTFLVGGLQLCLRLFGAFWIFGGILTFQAAKESLFMDQILDALNPKKEDRLLSYFLLLSSFLTIFTGGALLLARAWALLPLGILIASQIGLFRHRYVKEIPSKRIWRGKGMLARREELCMKGID